jgi:hypothetical protein
MLNSASKKLMKVVRQADVYGQPITLTYNRQNKFKTHLGGFSAILLGAFMAVYFSFLFWGLFAKSRINFTTTTIAKDLTVELDYLDIAKEGFFIAIGIRNNRYTLLEPEYRKYVELTVQEIEWILSPAGLWTKKAKNLKLEACGDNFAYKNRTIVEEFYFHKYVWVTSDDYQIGGNWYSERSKYIEIRIKKWSNSTYSTCESSDNITSFIEGKELDIVMLDKFFDLKNFDNPIGSYITEKYVYNVLDGFTRSSDIYIKQNNLELMDSVFQFKGDEKRKFYSIESEKIDLYKFVTTYLRARILPSPQEVTYNRTVYSFLDMVAQLGGVFNVLRSISFLILGFYAERMMYYWVLKKNYQFNSREQNEMPVYTEDDKRRLDNNREGPPLYPSKTTYFEARRESFQSPSTLHLNIRKSLLNKNYSESTPNEEIHFSPEQWNALGNEMKQRRRFDYSTLDFLYSAFWWVKYKYPWCKKNGKSVHDNYILFRKGLEKFYVDLDLLSVITTVRKMKVLTDLFFNDNQQLLEKYSKYHTIESANFDDLDHFKRIPQYKSSNLMESRFEHASTLNGSIRRMAKRPMSKIDLFLISQIDNDLMKYLMLPNGRLNYKIMVS